MYGEGISRVGEILDLAVDSGVIQKSGSWYSFSGKKLGQGRDATKETLTKDPELQKQIETRVREALKNGAADSAPKKSTTRDSDDGEED
jgi:recombination protein RecA